MYKKSQNHKEYISRINKVFDYVEVNIEKQFTLDKLASVANFSKFHFSRIFQAVVGETPFQFIMRLRLERAASILRTNKKETITELAYKCGFSDVSIFSRSFKKHFKKSPSEYRKTINKNSNISQIESKNKQDEDKISSYFCFKSNEIKWKTNMELNKSVEIKDLHNMNVAYVRHIGSYKGNENLFKNLWNKLFSWAVPRGLVKDGNFKSLIVYHDDPNVSNQKKLRTSVCITVPKETKVSEEIGKMIVEAGKCVVARFELKADQYSKAWEWVYGKWFPESGYQPDDLPCFEIYQKKPADGKSIVDICVPVKPI